MNSDRNLLIKGRVLQLHHDGLSNIDIHRTLKRSGTILSVSTLWDWCQKIKNGQSIVNNKSPSRPRSTSKEQDAIIVKQVLTQPLTSIKRHRDILQKKRGLDVSVDVILKRLSEQGYSLYKARCNPLINAKNRQHRLEWCRARRHWTVADWYKICWTDESKFELFRANKARFVVKEW